MRQKIYGITIDWSDYSKKIRNTIEFLWYFRVMVTVKSGEITIFIITARKGTNLSHGELWPKVHTLFLNRKTGKPAKKIRNSKRKTRKIRETRLFMAEI